MKLEAVNDITITNRHGWILEFNPERPKQIFNLTSPNGQRYTASSAITTDAELKQQLQTTNDLTAYLSDYFNHYVMNPRNLAFQINTNGSTPTLFIGQRKLAGGGKEGAYFFSGAQLAVAGLVIASGGTGLVVLAAGGALVGSGLAGGIYAVTSPDAEYTDETWAKTSAVGAISGLVSGGAGAAGTSLRVAAAGGAAGSVAGTVADAKINNKPELLEPGNLAKSATVGAVAGFLGGAAGQVGREMTAGSQKAAIETGDELLQRGIKAAVGAGAGASGGAGAQAADDILHGRDINMEKVGQAAKQGAVVGAVTAFISPANTTEQDVEPAPEEIVAPKPGQPVPPRQQPNPNQGQINQLTQQLQQQQQTLQGLEAAQQTFQQGIDLQRPLIEQKFNQGYTSGSITNANDLITQLEYGHTRHVDLSTKHHTLGIGHRSHSRATFTPSNNPQQVAARHQQMAQTRSNIANLNQQINGLQPPPPPPQQPLPPQPQQPVPQPQQPQQPQQPAPQHEPDPQPELQAEPEPAQEQEPEPMQEQEQEPEQPVAEIPNAAHNARYEGMALLFVEPQAEAAVHPEPKPAPTVEPWIVEPHFGRNFGDFFAPGFNNSLYAANAAKGDLANVRKLLDDKIATPLAEKGRALKLAVKHKQWPTAIEIFNSLKPRQQGKLPKGLQHTLQVRAIELAAGNGAAPQPPAAGLNQ